MTHPTHEELERWYDEGEDPSASAAAHVQACTACEGYLEGLRSLGDSLRVWADESVPPLGDGLADEVMARLGLQDAPVKESVEARVEAPKAVEPAAAHAPAPVISLSNRKRARAALWPALAIAAAAALAFTVRGGRGMPGASATSSAGPKGEQLIAQMMTPSDDAANEASNDAVGSEVVSVEVDGEHTLYAVLEVRGEGATKSMPLVWIEDDEIKGPGKPDDDLATEQQ